ncbi:hypothetical protein ACS0TY_005912 [Phlomoides rotata]
MIKYILEKVSYPELKFQLFLLFWAFVRSMRNFIHYSPASELVPLNNDQQLGSWFFCSFFSGESYITCFCCPK